MKRIRVPEGVIEAGVSAVRSYCAAHGYVGDDGHISDAWLGVVPEVVGAVLLHLSEHPQVPTDEQAKQLRSLLVDSLQYWFTGSIELKKEAAESIHGRIEDFLSEWQRRCFVQEESEIPTELKDLMFIREFVIEDESLYRNVKEKLEKVAAEAYRMGKESGNGTQ